MDPSNKLSFGDDAMTVVLEFAILGLSLIVLIPNLIRVWREWHSLTMRRRVTGIALLVIVASIPALGFAQGRLSDVASERNTQELAAVERSQAPRHLSADQIRILHSWIDGFRSQDADIAADTVATDAHGFAEELFAEFHRAGWRLHGRDPARPDVIDAMMTGGSDGEILVGVPDPGHMSPAATAVYDAFRAMGMGPVVERVALIQASRIEITVLPKFPQNPQQRDDLSRGSSSPPAGLMGLLAAIPASVGWFIGAFLAFGFGVWTEHLRWDHSRAGTRRQVKSLLRMALKVLEPFFYSYKRLQLNDVLLTYNRFTDRMNAKETADALSDDEHYALDAFVERFGQMVALAQQQNNKWADEDSGVPKKRSTPDDERRLFLAQTFSDPIGPLARCIEMVGDSRMREDVTQLQDRANKFVERPLEQITAVGLWEDLTVEDDGA